MTGKSPPPSHAAAVPQGGRGLPEDLFPSSFRWRHWILAALLALLFHVLLLAPKIPGFLSLSPSAAPPRVDIKQVDPRKLEEIRRKWRDQDKQLLIDKNPSHSSTSEPDPNARYMSDRNIRVEKEQRARRTEVVPKPGAPGEPRPESEQRPRREARPQQPKARSRGNKLPNLGQLGIPLPTAPAKPMERQEERPRQRAGQNGGEQYVDDPNLPNGSENLLNAQESIYYSFYARLYEAIGPVWQSRVRQASRMRRLNPGDYTTSLDVVFDRDGNLVAIHRTGSSGIDLFDQAADAAWRSLGRFPNPPSGLLDEKGEVHTGWTFTVQINAGFGFDSLPPERVY